MNEITITRALFAYIENGVSKEVPATKISNYAGEANIGEIAFETISNVPWKTLTLDFEVDAPGYEYVGAPTLAGTFGQYYDLSYNIADNIFHLLVSDKNLDTNETVGVVRLVRIAMKKIEEEKVFEISVTVSQ